MIKYVDINIIKDNIKIIKKKLEENNQKNCKICAVVKANAYGHGYKICKYIENDIYIFAVSCIEEAKAIKKLGIKKDILILGKILQNDIYAAIKQDFIISFDTIKDIKNINKIARKYNLFARVHIILNTGMNRYGFNTKELSNFFKLYESENFSNIIIEGAYSHISCSDENNYSKYQLNNYIEGIKFLNNEIANNKKVNNFINNYKKHFLSSNSLNLNTYFQFDYVRCGLAIYGYGENMQPAMKVAMEILEIRKLKQGDFLGYKNKFRCKEKEMQIAILNGGYADGVRRVKDLKVNINNKLCNIIGNICMDVCFADLTKCNAKVGDKAYLFWDKGSMEDLKTKYNTINYEILTNWNGRCKIKYIT